MKLRLIIILAAAMSFMQCKKERTDLVGSPSKADFSFAQSPAGDTLPYAYDITFANSSQDAFLFQWNFGDNSPVTAEVSPVHRYKAGGTYNVTLTSVGSFGNNSITKVISVFDACDNEIFNALTSCSYAEWTLSPDNDAIKVLYADGASVYSVTAANDCQLDDIFKFSANGSFSYDAGDQTFNAVTNQCEPPKPNTNEFKMVVRQGVVPHIILSTLSGALNNPFIGVTDSVTGNRYDVKSLVGNNLVLKATLNSGKILELKLKKKTALTIDDIKDLLTGGSSRSWKLDPTAGANAIIVGTEANPAEYYAGGPLEPNCQVDDIYTFSSSNTLNYNANGSTFNGGNIAPNYNCGADRSFTSPFTFGPVNGASGLAMITLPGIAPANFIGTTDIPENLYRIISITPSKMVLRAGSGSGVVFQFKFVRQ